MNRLIFFAVFLPFITLTTFVNGQDVESQIEKANEYYHQEKYDSAAMILEVVLPTLKNKYGQYDMVFYAKQVEHAATSFHNFGQLKKAEPYYLELIAIYKHNNVTMDTSYARVLNNFAEMNLARGRYEQAEPLFRKALEIDKILLGEENLNYGYDMINLAYTLYSLSRYEESEPLYLEAKDILIRNIGTNNPDYAIYLNNLAQLYTSMGRFELAEESYKQAIRIDRETLGTKNSQYARHLNNLATLYMKMEDYLKAEVLLKESVEIAKELYGENHPEYSIKLHNLASAYLNLKQYEEAEILGVKAYEIDRVQLGENHPNCAVDLNGLAFVYKATGRYTEAEEYIKKANAIVESNFGPYHNIYARGVNNLSRLYMDIGKYELAWPLMKQAFGIYRHQIITNTGFLSEKELEQFLSTFMIYLEFYQNVNLNLAGNDSSGSFAYDIELTRKGILLKSALGLKNRIIESGDTALVNDYNELVSIRGKINKLSASNSKKAFQELSGLEVKSNEMEKSLSLRSQDYKRELEETETTWKEVWQHLHAGEAAIEFSSFRLYNGKSLTDTIAYCAIVIRSGDTIPRMVYLCDEAQLRTLIPPSKAGDFKKINKAYLGASLYRMIWQPIENFLEGVTTVYFSPSGVLNSLSFSAISTPDKQLLGEKYDLVQMSTTRALALPVISENITDAVVYGGIVYDVADTLTLQAKARKYHVNAGEQLTYTRSLPPGNRGSFGYLPGTLKEAQSVSGLLEKKGMKADMITGMDALEDSFYALSGSGAPSLIHLSTHGFYFPDTISDANREKMNLSTSGDVVFKYSDDPLLRSGLLMAGANLTWKGLPRPEGLEDGILTAKEVSNMDLRKTQLVVLSACQTGQGDVKGSEGVEGLQRGFRMAGARFLVMSLWEIPDRETTEFMEIFYGNLVSSNNIPGAFKTTQLAMMNKYREAPYKWAGFVLVE